MGSDRAKKKRRQSVGGGAGNEVKVEEVEGGAPVAAHLAADDGKQAAPDESKAKS